MLRSLHIEGFRSFPSLAVAPLSRVNVLVGKNNTGKSSVLEAVELLVRDNVRWGLWAIPVRRGEIAYAGDERAPRTEADVRHLFLGHELRPDAAFRIGEGALPGDGRVFTVSSSIAIDPAAVSLPGRFGDMGAPRLGITVRRGEESEICYLSPEGGLAQPYANGEPTPVHVLGADPLTRFLPGPAAAALWEKVVLTPSEGRVTSALAIVEPAVERLAAAPRPGNSLEFFVKLKGSDGRVPLASMGEGSKRLLALALSVVTSAGGTVIIDDIDTGLHHSVITKMWQLVIETARELDVQVFATTQSLDCLTSLASLLERAPLLHDSVTVHRLERGSDRSIAFTAQDVMVAARHEMELR